jgi:membrane-bound ClpP family serine protease
MPVGAIAARMRSLKAAVVGTVIVASAVGAMAADNMSVSRANPKPSVIFPDAVLTQFHQNDVTTLRLDGILTPATEQHFAQALHALPAGRPVVVELSSPGGYTLPGYRMIDTILAERQAGRPVATRVKADESCESMCVGLYLAGYPRYAAPSAEFMVHAPRAAESGQITVRSTHMMVKRLVALGAAQGWIEKVKAAGGFSGNIDYRERADSLAASRANVVTDLIY